MYRKVSFVSGVVVNILGMRITRNYIPLMGMNNEASDARYSVNKQLCSRYSNFQAQVVGLILPKITENVTSRCIQHDSCKLPTYLFCADPRFAHPEDVHILIGAELIFHLLRPGKTLAVGQFPRTNKLNRNKFWRDAYNIQGG